MESAIKLAVEKGYRYDGSNAEETVDFSTNSLFFSDMILDKNFWKCLRSALGARIKSKHPEIVYASQYDWKIDRQSFFDHTDSGKDANSFFSALISTKE